MAVSFLPHHRRQHHDGVGQQDSGAEGAPDCSTRAASRCEYGLCGGALNAVDSAAYDTLLIAETAIDQSRMAYQSGQLPSDSKDALDTLIRSYNAARDSWLTYRGAIATNTPSGQYMEQLNKNLSDLTSAIRALKRKGVKP